MSSHKVLIARGMSKSRPLDPHGRGQAMQNAPEVPVHVALIAEASIARDLAILQLCFAQQPRGALDAQACGCFQDAFPNDLSVRRSQPRRVPIDLSCQIARAHARILPQPARQLIDPCWAADGRLPECERQELPHRHRQSLFIHRVATGVDQGASRGANATARQVGDGDTRDPGKSQPRGIELDLHLLEPIGRDSVRVMGSGAIQHGRRGAHVPLADFSAAGIPAEDEERQYRPVVRVFRDLGMAAIDDPRDDGSCECMQQHSGFANWPASDSGAYCRAAGGATRRSIDLESVQYAGASARPCSSYRPPAARHL